MSYTHICTWRSPLARILARYFFIFAEGDRGSVCVLMVTCYHEVGASGNSNIICALVNWPVVPGLNQLLIQVIEL